MDAAISTDDAADWIQPRCPKGSIRFDRATIQLIEGRCWHPDERIEGSVLVPRAMLEGCSRLMEIRVVLRRVVQFPGSLMDQREGEFVTLADLAPLRSEQCSVDDHIIYGARGTRGAAWRGFAHSDTDTVEFTFCLLLPNRCWDEVVTPIATLVDFDLVVMATREADGSDAREVAAIKNLQFAPWDKPDVSRHPELPSAWSLDWLERDRRGWKFTRSDTWLEAYPSAPWEHRGKLVTHFYTPDQDLVAGRTYSVVFLLFAQGTALGSLDKVDWNHLMPTLPSPGSQDPDFQLRLQAFLEYGSSSQPRSVIRVRQPQLDVAGLWFNGHLDTTAAADWAERPCEGIGWQAPSLHGDTMRWTRCVHLAGRLTIPHNYPASFHLKTNSGNTVSLRHIVAVDLCLDHAPGRAHRQDGQISDCFSTQRVVRTTSGHVPHTAEGPPDYAA